MKDWIKTFISSILNQCFDFQTHPNVDKELFKMKSQIGLKNPSKPFPLGTDVGVLKWRYQSTDESALPLTSTYHLLTISWSVAIYFDLMKLTFKQSGILFYFLAKTTRYMINMKYFTINGTTEDCQNPAVDLVTADHVTNIFLCILLLLLRLFEIRQSPAESNAIYNI